MADPTADRAPGEPTPAWGDVTQLEGRPHYRLDFDSCDADEQWEHLCSAQEMLRLIGWQIEDPNLEHDCLTGFLIPARRSRSNRCPNCEREIPLLWAGRCFPCEDRKAERAGRALVDLTHGEIRFLMWALPQADLWTDEGMKAWADMGNRDRLVTKLRKCLPEAKDNCEAT